MPLQSVRYKLPVENARTGDSPVDPDVWPIMSLSCRRNIKARLSCRCFDKVIADRLRGLPGVAVVEISGDAKRELTVLLRSEKCACMAFQWWRCKTPCAIKTSRPQRQGIRRVKRIRYPPAGRLTGPADFANMVIRRKGEQVLRLSDVADVEDGVAEPDKINFFNGKPSIGINIIRTREASTVSVSKAVRHELDEMRKDPKPGTRIDIANDGGDWAQSSPEQCHRGLGIGAGLTILWSTPWFKLLALHGDHRPIPPHSVLAAFIAVVVGIFAELYDPCWPVLGHWSAD